MDAKRLLVVATTQHTLFSFLRPFARHLTAQGWRVDALARPDAAAAECAGAFDRVWPIEWSRNPLDPRNLLGPPRQVRELVEREGYDVVHVHTPVAAFVTRYGLRRLRGRARPKIIYTAHGFHFYHGCPQPRHAAFLNLEKLAGHWTDYLVVMNREDELAAKRYGIVPPERVCYMPGIGLDTELYSPAAVPASEVARVRAELDLRPGQPLFLVVAEFVPRKRHRDAIRSFGRLRQPHAHLALAGDGPLIEPVRRLAADLGIAERVHFLGLRRDIPSLIRASTAVLLPSEQEGLPRSLMEASSLAVPVIGANIRGVRDLIAQEMTGLLVKVGDVDGLAGAMTWILEHPADARAMAERGQRQAERYDLRHILALHDQLYARALEPERAGRCPAPAPSS